jgi:hypothetical protein
MKQTFHLFYARVPEYHPLTAPVRSGQQLSATEQPK